MVPVRLPLQVCDLCHQWSVRPPAIHLANWVVHLVAEKDTLVIGHQVGVGDLRVDLRLLEGDGEVSHIYGRRSLHVGLLFFIRSLPFLRLDFPRDPLVRDHESPGGSIHLLSHAHVLHLVHAGANLAASQALALRLLLEPWGRAG